MIVYPLSEPEVFTSNVPKIVAEPVYGKASPAGAYEADKAFVAKDADRAYDEDIEVSLLIACDADVAVVALPVNGPINSEALI